MVSDRTKSPWLSSPTCSSTSNRCANRPHRPRQRSSSARNPVTPGGLGGAGWYPIGRNPRGYRALRAAVLRTGAQTDHTARGKEAVARGIRSHPAALVGQDGIRSDEIPVAIEPYVQQYFEQVRKQTTPPAAKKQ